MVVPFLMICDAFLIIVVTVRDTISVCMLFFESFETLAPPILQRMMFYKFNH